MLQKSQITFLNILPFVCKNREKRTLALIRLLNKECKTIVDDEQYYRWSLRFRSAFDLKPGFKFINTLLWRNNVINSLDVRLNNKNHWQKINTCARSVEEAAWDVLSPLPLNLILDRLSWLHLKSLTLRFTFDYNSDRNLTEIFKI
jgi:hypothetical protein